ncbi:MAG: hypothetical protein V4596_08630 [Bdellovibrionota bacterium]
MGSIRNKFSYKSVSIFLTVGMLALTSLLFVNCSGGGSGGNGNNGGNNGAGALQSLTPLHGLWIQGNCVQLSSTSSTKNFYQIANVNSTTVSQNSGNMTYSGTACVGTGTIISNTYIGQAVFNGTDDYVDATHGARKFFHGTVTMVSGLVQDQIWALKTNTLLCIFPDDPTFINAEQINTYVNTISNNDCHTKN